MNSYEEKISLILFRLTGVFYGTNVVL